MIVLEMGETLEGIARGERLACIAQLERLWQMLLIEHHLDVIEV